MSPTCAESSTKRSCERSRAGAGGGPVRRTSFSAIVLDLLSWAALGPERRDAAAPAVRRRCAPGPSRPQAGGCYFAAARRLDVRLGQSYGSRVPTVKYRQVAVLLPGG